MTDFDRAAVQLATLGALLSTSPDRARAALVKLPPATISHIAAQAANLATVAAEVLASATPAGHASDGER